MAGAIALAVILVVVVVASGIFGARLGRRFGTPRGATPKKIERRVWVALGMSVAIGLAGAAWLWWAIDHHHRALGVLVLVGLYVASHFATLAVRYRHDRRGVRK